MTFRQTETSREIRLWLGQIVVPAAVGIAMIPAETRKAICDAAKDKAKKAWNSVSGVFKRSS